MDLSDVSFYPEETIQIKTLGELRDNVNIFSGFDSAEVVGSSIRIEEDGQITVDGETRQCTESGMRYLCKALRIPDPFAKRIPFDLLRFTLHRLLADVEAVKVFSSNSNNHWVNLTGPRAWGVPIIPLIEQIEEDLESLDMISGEISENGVILDFRSDQIPEVEDHLEVGSITQFGRRFSGSEAGFGYPMSSFIAHRLVCSNGMVAPRSFGQVKCRNRGNSEAQIASFVRRCRAGAIQIGRFAATYAAIAADSTIMPTNKQLHRILNGTRKVIGDADLADEIVGIDNELRSELRSAVKRERRFNLSDEIDEEVDAPSVTEVPRVVNTPWFTLINRVTRSANDVSGRPKSRLQELGGKALALASETIVLLN